MGISYAITAYNEIKELKRLIPLLQKHLREDDEIVVLLDTTATSEVRNYVKEIGVVVLEHSLNNHFGDFKNVLNKACQKEWIIQIDADEYFNETFLYNSHEILEVNEDVDVILVPRINTVEGLTQDDISKWGWRVDEDKRINFPDYQWRIYKNKPSIYWIKPVHEQLTGFNTISKLPPEEEYCLYHPKKIERQREQNKKYNEIIYRRN